MQRNIQKRTMLQTQQHGPDTNPDTGPDFCPLTDVSVNHSHISNLLRQYQKLLTDIRDVRSQLFSLGINPDEKLT